VTLQPVVAAGAGDLAACVHPDEPGEGGRMERQAAPADIAPEAKRVAPPAPSEPATARALWPTFMRRTLAEDLLRADGPEASRA
jgi:hypothetical protein